MKVKEESEKVGLKLKFRKQTMASSPITSWQIDGKTVETVADFIFLGSKINADGDCSHEITFLYWTAWQVDTPSFFQYILHLFFKKLREKRSHLSLHLPLEFLNLLHGSVPS